MFKFYYLNVTNKISLVQKFFLKQFRKDNGINLTTVLTNIVVMQAVSFGGKLKLVRGRYEFQ